MSCRLTGPSGEIEFARHARRPTSLIDPQLTSPRKGQSQTPITHRYGCRSAELRGRLTWTLFIIASKTLGFRS